MNLRSSFQSSSRLTVHKTDLWSLIERGVTGSTRERHVRASVHDDRGGAADDYESVVGFFPAISLTHATANTAAAVVVARAVAHYRYGQTVHI